MADASTTMVQQIATLPNLVAVTTAIIAGAIVFVPCAVVILPIIKKVYANKVA